MRIYKHTVYARWALGAFEFENHVCRIADADVEVFEAALRQFPQEMERVRQIEEEDVPGRQSRVVREMAVASTGDMHLQRVGMLTEEDALARLGITPAELAALRNQQDGGPKASAETADATQAKSEAGSESVASGATESSGSTAEDGSGLVDVDSGGGRKAGLASLRKA